VSTPMLHVSHDALARACDALFLVDMADTITYANPQAERLLDAGPGELSGIRFVDLVTPVPDAGGAWEGPVRTMATVIGHFEADLSMPHGGQTPVEISVLPQSDDEGNLSGYLYIVRDMRDRRRSESLAHQRRAELEALTAMSAVLTTSHEPQRLLQVTLQKVLEVVRCDAAAISLLDVESQTMPIVAQTNLPSEFLADRVGRGLGEGYMGEVALTGRPRALNLVPLAPEGRDYGLRSCAAAPLKAHARTLGVLEVFRRSGEPFDEQAVQLLITIGIQLGIAYQHAWLWREMEANLEAQRYLRAELERRAAELATLYQREQRRFEQLRVANELGRRITSILERDHLLWDVVELLSERFAYYYVIVAVVDNGELVVQAAYGRDSGRDDELVGINFGQQERGLVAWVARHGETVVVPDVASDPRYLRVESLRDVQSAIAVPMRGREGMLGVLDIESDRPADFDESDTALLEALAAHVAVAIENARLYAQIREVGKLEERNRLAREIHDTLAQGFTGIVLQLEAAEQAMQSDQTGALEHLSRARQLARESLAEARRSVWDLRPSPLEHLTLVEAVRREVDRFLISTRGQIMAQVTLPDQLMYLPVTIQAALLRIVQEALTNVGRHAHAHEVNVVLARHERGMVLRISDDGIGIRQGAIASEAGSGFGLISMRERTQLIGGTFAIRSEEGRGTSVEVIVPDSSLLAPSPAQEP